MATPRDRDNWSYIFQLYQSLPYLWDKGNIHYGNRTMTANGYKILTRAYREKIDRQASIGVFRTKMKNLRTTFYRELRRVKECRKKGKIHKPSLWYFDDLSFLAISRSGESTSATSDENKTVTNTENMLDAMEVPDIPQDFVEMDDLALDSDLEVEVGPSPSQARLARRTESQKKNSTAIERLDYTDTGHKIAVTDEQWEVIGKSIGYQLRDLNKKQYTIVSKLISDAIYFGRLNRLTEASHIEVGSLAASSSASPPYPSYTLPVHKDTEIHVVDIPTHLDQIANLKTEVDVNSDDD